jgi:hypothetical protein
MNALLSGRNDFEATQIKFKLGAKLRKLRFFSNQNLFKLVTSEYIY